MRIGSRTRLAPLAGALALLLTACGGGSSSAKVNASTARGTLVYDPPPRLASLTAADFTAELQGTPDGPALLALATGRPTGGSLPFGVDVYYLQYETVGGAGEPTTATGALMVPTQGGASPGPRPILLYAHGTEFVKGFNMAGVTGTLDPSVALVAALFAANGYIVVAPNYAGYDASTLPYHPYLNADQQSKDMIDALAASRKALPDLFRDAPADSGKLFIMGYSQGGHVAMATHRAMEALGMTVTASAPASGPYALSAFADALVYGNVDAGSTGFTPLITASYYNSYRNDPAVGNIYNATGNPSDAYEDAWAQAAGSEFPGGQDLTPLLAAGKWPLALFSDVPPGPADIAAGLGPLGITGTEAATLTAELGAILPGLTPPPGNPLYAAGFAAPPMNLLRNSYRAGYLADALLAPDGAVPAATTGLPAVGAAHPLRKAFIKNDLRGWIPRAPLFMSGGHNDPVVYYPVNTGTMFSLWQAAGGLVPAIVPPPYDVDPGIDLAGIGTAAGTAFGADVAGGVTDPAVFAADMAQAVNAYLAGIPASDPLQHGFLQATGLAVSSQLTAQAVGGVIASVTGSQPPFTTAVLAPRATVIAQALGTQASLVVTAAYHGTLAAPFCHAAALKFFSNF